MVLISDTSVLISFKIAKLLKILPVYFNVDYIWIVPEIYSELCKNENTKQIIDSLDFIKKIEKESITELENKEINNAINSNSKLHKGEVETVVIASRDSSNSKVLMDDFEGLKFSKSKNIESITFIDIMFEVLSIPGFIPKIIGFDSIHRLLSYRRIDRKLFHSFCYVLKHREDSKN